MNKYKSVFSVMIFVLLLSSIAFASPDRYGRGYENPDEGVIVESGKANIFQSIIQSIIGFQAVTGLQASYKPGDVVSVQSYGYMYETCSNAQMVIELYNAPKTSQTTSTYVGGNFKSLGAIGPGTYFANLAYTLPGNAKIGTWSISGYIYCAEKNPRPADYSKGGYFGPVSEEDFQVSTATVATSVCGDGVISGNEFCDSNTRSCTAFGGYAGTQSCNPTCTGYYSCGSTQKCGDGILNGNEQCDGSKLAGASCSTFGFTSGTLSCKTDCTYDKSKCTNPPSQLCGNGIVEGTEICDGANVGSQTCQTRGFASGTLKCNTQCSGYDTSQCTTGPTPPSVPTNPNIVIDSSNVVVNGKQVVGTIILRNAGGDMTTDYLVEMQVWKPEVGPLAVVSPSQGTCDATHPENVHKFYRLTAGESTTIQLTSPSTGSLNDGAYNAGFFLVTKCAKDGGTTLPGYTSRGPFGQKSVQIGVPPSSPNFQVQIIDAPAVVDSRQDNVQIKVRVTNTGGPGSMLVEGGIYDQAYADIYTQSVASISEAPNCRSYETNVDTKNVTFRQGDSNTVDISLTVKTPLVCSLTGFSGTSEFSIVAGAYTRCSPTPGADEDTVGSGYSDSDIRSITINQEFGLFCSGTCEDGIINREETSTDCGDDSKCVALGKLCPIDFKCETDKDCATGLVCLAVGGSDGKTPICRPEDEREDDIRTSCPDPTSENVCIPNGCRYSDLVPSTTQKLIIGLTPRETYCCAESEKIQQSEDKFTFLTLGYIEQNGVCKEKSGFGQVCEFYKGIGIENCTVGLVGTAFVLLIVLRLFGGK